MKKIIVLLFVFINSFLFSQSNGALNIHYLGDNKDKGIPYRYGTSGPFFSDSVYFSEDGFLYIFQVDGILRKYDMNMNVVYSIDLIEKDKRVFWIRQNWARAIVKNNKIYVLVCPTEDSGRGLLVFSMSGELLYEKMGGFVGIDQAVSNGFEVIENKMIFLGSDEKLYNISLEDLKKGKIPVKIDDIYNTLSGYHFSTKSKSINDDIAAFLNTKKAVWIGTTLYNFQAHYFSDYILPKLSGINANYDIIPEDGIMKEINNLYSQKFGLKGFRSSFDLKKNIYIMHIYKSGQIKLFLFNAEGTYLGLYTGTKPNITEKIKYFFMAPNGDIMFWAEYIPEGENQGSNNIRMRYYKILNTWSPIPDATVQTYLDDLNKPQPAKIKRISTSGYASEQFDKYISHPTKLFDGNPKTAWIENSKDFGTKAFVEVEFQSPILIDEIRISGGYFDAQYYNSNNRLKKARLTINSNTYVMDFADQMAPQSFKLTTAQELGKFGIEILEAYIGTGQTRNDTAISEIEFYYKGKKVEIDLGDYSQYSK